jgi:hypothetical protein
MNVTLNIPSLEKFHLNSLKTLEEERGNIRNSEIFLKNNSYLQALIKYPATFGRICPISSFYFENSFFCGLSINIYKKVVSC